MRDQNTAVTIWNLCLLPASSCARISLGYVIINALRGTRPRTQRGWSLKAKPLRAGAAVVVVRKGCTTLTVTKEGAAEKHEVSGAGWGGDGGGMGRGGRLKRVPKLPASDDQSVHQRGLRGARWNSSAGRTKKHPPWESAFFCRQMPSDGLGRPVRTQCICGERGCVGRGSVRKTLPLYS